MPKRLKYWVSVQICTFAEYLSQFRGISAFGVSKRVAPSRPILPWKPVALGHRITKNDSNIPRKRRCEVCGTFCQNSKPFMPVIENLTAGSPRLGGSQLTKAQAALSQFERRHL
jgi:hypothetical protein